MTRLYAKKPGLFTKKGKTTVFILNRLVSVGMLRKAVFLRGMQRTSVIHDTWLSIMVQNLTPLTHSYANVC